MLNIFLPKKEPQESSSFENDCEETAAYVWKGMAEEKNQRITIQF